MLLSMIMHDWSERENRAILRKCYEALPHGGAVVISELLVNDDKTGPAPAALMSLNMLIETVDEFAHDRCAGTPLAALSDQ